MAPEASNPPVKPPAVRVTNSLTHAKEVLETKVPGKVTLYSCGPTVYGLIHMGNLRAALTSDLFYRCLTGLGYEVTYVRNYTDVDDKIITKANEDGTTVDVVTKKFIGEAERDYAVSGALEPTHKTLVTEHMPEIIELIERIIQNGAGYVTDDGDVNFAIDQFPDYGKLSGKKPEDLLAGARVEVNAKKKNPFDFALWKAAKPEEPAWDSPWGKGRPGWHIECSAMAWKWLGDEIDIHHGGSDLTFPHHENEIAQSECALGHKPYVRYWLHHAMLNIGAEKMSKSLGNFVTARAFLTEYGGEITRFFLLSSHYRSIADFTDEALATSIASLQRLYEAKEKAQSIAQLKAALPDLRAESLWGSFVAEVDQCRKDIREHICNDFNTPGVFGAVFTLVREWNRILAEPKASGTPTAVIAAGELLKLIEGDLFTFTGIGRASPANVFEKIQELKKKKATASATSAAETTGNSGNGGAEASAAALSDDEINARVQARTEAKKAKNFAEADRIRKELLDRGIEIKDSPTGTTWQWK